MLLTLDMFSEPLPGFNVRGERSVRTHIGGCISLIIIYVLFLHGMLKFEHLVEKHNPSVNKYMHWNAFSDYDLWKGSENEDFMMAFAVVDFVTNEVKDDPSYVKWFAEYIHSKNNNKTYSEVGMRICTEEDFKKFHPHDINTA